MPNSQDLLAEIFGSGSSTTTQPPPPQKSSVNDILDLFGSSPAPAATAASPQAVSTPSVSSLFASVAQTSAPPPASIVQAAPAAPASRLQAYTAYDRSGLKVTMTPQLSPQGAPQGAAVVNILVKFQSTASEVISNIVFQAAVPRVETFCLYYHEPYTDLFSVRPNNCKCSLCPIQWLIQTQQKHNACA